MEEEKKTSEFNIEAELAKLPHTPGVYLMHSDTQEILYVGKAVDLHNRVRQYFRNGFGHNFSPKIGRMVSQIAYFEYIKTGSELEALVLECNLIKEIRPRYNTLMTDDKEYPYIRVTTGEAYPRILYSHRMSRDNARYFGPFTDRSAVKDTLSLVRRLFKIRRCSRDIEKTMGKNRPCLYYQIGECSGPCSGMVSQEEYRQQIEDALRFLDGDTKEITRRLTQQMKQEAADMEFEKAAKTRDLLSSIATIMEHQRINLTSGEDRDVIALARNEKDSVLSVFFMRDGRLIGRETHHMETDPDEPDCQVMTAFLHQYYAGTPYIPGEVLLNIPPEDTALTAAFLENRRKKKCHIILPQKGEKHKMLQLAEDNARLVMEQDIERMRRHEKRTTGACRELADIVGLPSVVRLEAFDISNISGYHSVASMVVFENGEARRNAYRKFRLRTVTGPDDYASMKEVLSRRFTNDSLGRFPDILMMDGGKGQVHIAETVLDSLGIEIPVCGMVKDDNHRTRGLYYKDREIAFPRGSEAMHMITALQDETHRFAITYHKLLRSKEQVHSILDDIEGIGPKRRQALLLRFSSAEGVKNATLEELAETDGMNRKSAEAVYHFFHEGETSDPDMTASLEEEKDNRPDMTASLEEETNFE